MNRRLSQSWRRFWDVARHGGVRGVATRSARIAVRRLGITEEEFPLFAEDIADSSKLDLPAPDHSPGPGSPLRIGWIMTPPSLGSGGHTTIFRMIEALQDAGHSSRIFLYDRYSGSAARHAEVIRAGWPSITADVLDAAEGIDDVDALFATSWQTAHVLAIRPHPPVARFYFIQDYEPFFYPHGSEHALATDSYRFGFRCITVGQMLPEILSAQFGITATPIEFGCDRTIYQLSNVGERRGVVFYARPNVPRRGYRLGVAALAEFHRMRPDQPIHIFGERAPDIPFPAVQHGKLRPAELNTLYNDVVAGLALSFTNVSLVPDELLASGAIPVSNTSEYTTGVLSNPYVRWADPTPAALAAQLVAAVDEAPTLDVHAVAASAREGWGDAQEVFVRTVEAETYRPA